MMKMWRDLKASPPVTVLLALGFLSSFLLSLHFDIILEKRRKRWIPVTIWTYTLSRRDSLPSGSLIIGNLSGVKLILSTSLTHSSCGMYSPFSLGSLLVERARSFTLRLANCS